MIAPTSHTDRYAVIGNPIAQSKSPTIHGMFAQATHQHMVYTKIESPLGGFAATVDAFRAEATAGTACNNSGEACGLNITAPFKLDAFAYATQRSERAQLVGAANALKFERTEQGISVIADNFDGIGLVRDVVHNLACPLAGKRVLIIGAGGATRGALLPLLAEKPSHLVVANRTVATAHELATLVAAHGSVQAAAYPELNGQVFDVVFNATSASLRAELPPLPASVFAPGCIAYDLTYGKGLTPFLLFARNAGVVHLADGVGMLVEQAAEAFAWWRGVRPATRAVIDHITVPLV
jgi:shikimate dehydrogenase